VKGLTDIEIARKVKLLPIEQIASKIKIPDKFIYPYGKYIAKIDHRFLKELNEKSTGKLIIVTAMTPTKFGEGKTTTSIGLSQAINKIGKSSIVTLREPSLGPVMGIKGGATGGGYSQVLPMEDINLHFTGDIHAVTTAHNLLSAMIDASIKFGNPLNINPTKIYWPRAMDMNDRALRNIVVALGGSSNGLPREDHFIITAASEVMAVLCLSEDLEDLKERLGKIIVAETFSGEFVRASDLKANNAMAVILKDAINPNLVQTIENTPAIIHGGPFANIAHGTNSVIATELALKLSDYVVTETGFGADLGAEKFFDVVAPMTGITPNCVVLVATVRALKLHGGKSEKEIETEDIGALKNGMKNLLRHIENMKKYNLPVVVAINRFPSDTDREIEVLSSELEELGILNAVSDVWAKGGNGAMDLAKKVIESCDESDISFKPIYDWNEPISSKIEKIAKEIYRASNVEYSQTARIKIKKFERSGFGNLPVIIAKTQYSFSDNPKLLGAPGNFVFSIKDVSLSAGAGFLVALAGDIMTMPGLPKIPNAVNMNIDNSGNIEGLF
jgi:formate--tetrahydrofolate ligase